MFSTVHRIAWGRLYLEEREGALSRVRFFRPEELLPLDVQAVSPLLHEACDQLDAYFAGRLRSFDLPLAPQGTDFQRRVWDELRRIDWGQTHSYGEVACAVGSPRGARAVGMACNRNPLLIVVPCHRVIGADGSLVGFGEGLELKRRLLTLERVRLTLEN